jgi:hypothetical protein
MHVGRIAVDPQAAKNNGGLYGISLNQKLLSRRWKLSSRNQTLLSRNEDSRPAAKRPASSLSLRRINQLIPTLDRDECV